MKFTKYSALLGGIIILVIGFVLGFLSMATLGWFSEIYGIGKYEKASPIDLIIVLASILGNILVAIYIRIFLIDNHKKQLLTEIVLLDIQESKRQSNYLFKLIDDISVLSGSSYVDELSLQVSKLKKLLISFYKTDSYDSTYMLLEEISSWKNKDNDSITKLKELKDEFDSSLQKCYGEL